MRRWLSFAVAVLACSPLAGVGAGAATGRGRRPAARPAARLRLPATRSIPPNRSISVTAVMRPVDGHPEAAAQVRPAGQPRTAAPATTVARRRPRRAGLTPKNPTLGQLPGRRVELPEVGRRARRAGDVPLPGLVPLAGRRRPGARARPSATARRCPQRELRPDLMVVSPIAVTPIPGNPNQDRYTAVIRNAGATAAGPFVVLFVPRGCGQRADRERSSDCGPTVERAPSRRFRSSGPCARPPAPPDDHRRLRPARSTISTGPTTRCTPPARLPRRQLSGVRRGATLHSTAMKTEIHPELRRGPRALHVRQRVHDPLDPVRDPRRDLLRLPPVLHRSPEAGRHRWARRALPAPRRQGPAQRSRRAADS